VKNTFELKTDDGTILAERLSPEGFCSGLRQLTEGARMASEIEGLKLHNGEALTMLRTAVPQLKTAQGKHYADILSALMKKRERALLAAITVDLKDAEPKPAPVAPTSQASGAPEPAIRTTPQEPLAAVKPPGKQPGRESPIALGPAIDKSVLMLASPRRIRNKAHLARVGANPCLICEECPCHAHHVTFAQPRGLSVKVSDEFTVPLCALHHNDLHRAGNEEVWWRKAGIDPLAAALALWQRTLAITVPQELQTISRASDD
jgi:hypothetical protein